MDPLVYKARLRLLSTAEGGRQRPIASGDCPDWDLGETWLGGQFLTGGKVQLDEGQELAPGDEGEVLIAPRFEEGWGGAEFGEEIAMHEGARVVGYATLTGVAWLPSYFTSEVATFAYQARQFAAFVEQAHQLALPQRLADAAARLQALYEAGLNLPHVDPQDHEEIASCFVCGEDGAPSAAQALQREEPAAPAGSAEMSEAAPPSWPGFGDYERSEDEAEAADTEEDEAAAEAEAGDAATDATLSEVFLAIYGHAQRGQALWQRDRASRPAAIWQWFSDFDGEWIDLAVDALQRLQRANGERA